ncbi:uncharacterized protein C8Q71DRAFT_678985, partial [Rhodofomes roseus]
VSVVRRCSRIDAGDMCSSFVFIMQYIQLACKTSSIRRLRNFTIGQVYDEYLANIEQAPSWRTFANWNAIGSKFAAIAAGGSIYALLLIVLAGQRTLLTASINEFAYSLADVLRDPGDTDTGTIVVQQIIPAINALRSYFPLTFDSLFSPDQLKELGLATTVLDCTDLQQSDVMFDSLILNRFTAIKRNPVAWASCLSGVPTEPQCHGAMSLAQISQAIFHPGHCGMNNGSTSVTVLDEDDEPGTEQLDNVIMNPELVSNSCIQVEQFSLSHDAHRSYPVPRSHSEATAWTEKERLLAQAAQMPETLEDLKDKLSSIYSNGGRANYEEYIRIKPDIAGGPLCIDDSDGSLIACILPHMPEDMRRMLTVHLKACFEDEPENLEETDSSSQGERYSFPALHFSWYNRHGTRGHDVPVDAHPMLIEREDTSRTNYSQMLPYESREKTKHMKLYNNLNRIFARVFEWIAGQIKDVLRMDYDDLRIDADMLPGNAHSIVYPFLSLVVNLNVATLAH